MVGTRTDPITAAASFFLQDQEIIPISFRCLRGRFGREQNSAKLCQVPTRLRTGFATILLLTESHR